MRLAAFDFSPRCSYFHSVSLCLPPRCSPPLMCCRRAASRSALASIGCRRRLRSLATLHSRSELKHQKSAFRRSENCGRPRSRFNKDRTRLSRAAIRSKSAQLPHAPIWVGGEVERARRRAGRLGNGWYPVAANPRIPLDTRQLYGDASAEVRAEAERAGRDPGQIVGTILAIYCRIRTEQQGREDGRLAEVSKRSLTISATFRSVGCSIA
jgi:hypothetical protein